MSKDDNDEEYFMSSISSQDLLVIPMDLDENAQNYKDVTAGNDSLHLLEDIIVKSKVELQMVKDQYKNLESAFLREKFSLKSSKNQLEQKITELEQQNNQLIRRINEINTFDKILSRKTDNIDTSEKSEGSLPNQKSVFYINFSQYMNL